MALDPELARCAEEEPERRVDVVVALERPELAPGKRSRKELIKDRRAAFDDASAPVKELVKRHGGDVTDEAWLSSSLQVTVPAGALKSVEAATGVRAVDVPPPLVRDDGERTS